MSYSISGLRRLQERALVAAPEHVLAGKARYFRRQLMGITAATSVGLAALAPLTSEPPHQADALAPSGIIAEQLIDGVPEAFRRFLEVERKAGDFYMYVVTGQSERRDLAMAQLLVVATQFDASMDDLVSSGDFKTALAIAKRLTELDSSLIGEHLQSVGVRLLSLHPGSMSTINEAAQRGADHARELKGVLLRREERQEVIAAFDPASSRKARIASGPSM